MAHLPRLLRAAGLELIFNPDRSEGDARFSDPTRDDLVAILNLPEEDPTRVGCLTLYFYDATPIEAIAYALQSVRLNTNE